MAKAKRAKDGGTSGAVLGFEEKLWLAADKLRGSMDAAEGRLDGEFFTPQSVGRVLVEMVEPFKGRVYDPCCGSGGMFVQSERFVEARGGSDWGGEHLREDPRWAYGAPPVGNANFAWLQHIASHLHPRRRRGRRPRQRIHVVAAVQRGRHPQGDGRARPRRLHGRPPRPALLRHPDPRVPVVPREEQGRRALPQPPRRGALPRRPQAGRSSTAPTRSSPTTTSPASPAPTTPGAARRAPGSTRTSPASARAPRWRRSARTTTCSPPGATSARRTSRKTASPSKRR